MFQVKNSSNSAEILFHGDLGWGLDPADIIEDVRNITSGNITVRFNSNGGDAFAGIAIMHALREHPAHVTGIVEGIAASAASVVAVGGCDELIMRPGSQLMIHDAMTWADGSASELIKQAELLESVSNDIAAVYAGKTGTDVELWRNAMREETWFNADEALAAGLADRIVDGRVSNVSKSKVYNKFKGRRGAPCAQLIKKEAPLMGVDQGLIEAISKSVVTALVESGVIHNVSNSAPDDTVGETEAVEATDVPDVDENASSEQLDADLDTDEGVDEDEHQEVTEDEPDTEMVTIDKQTFDELQAAAKCGWELKEKAEAEARTSEVDNWVKEGRISAAVRQKALKLMHADPDLARSTFGSNPVNTIPRKEVGHAIGEDTAVGVSLSKSANLAGLFQKPTV